MYPERDSTLVFLGIVVHLSTFEAPDTVEALGMESTL